MEKKRSIKIIALLAILIAITGMSFSFASMSSKLDIQGFAQMGNANWDIHFENLETAKIKGQALEISQPTITNKSTTISTFGVKLQAPEDAIEYLFDVVNDGGMDAKITTLQLPKPICRGMGETKETDEQLVCQHLTYQLTYRDGSPVHLGDVLKRRERQQLKITLSYQGTELPIEEVTIENLAITLIYSQN